MAEELLVDLVEYRVAGGVHLAVDVHRYDPGGVCLDLSEELDKRRGLASPWGAQA